MSGRSGPRWSRPCPSSVMFAWLVVMLVPLGNASVEPSRASQVPAVRVLPETCAMVAARPMVPDSASMVPVLIERAVDQDRGCAGTGGLLDRPGIDDRGLAAAGVVDAGI